MEKMLDLSNQIPISNSSVSMVANLTDGYQANGRTELKIMFGLIMASLCFVTIVGNMCVIYRYRKASMVRQI